MTSIRVKPLCLTAAISIRSHLSQIHAPLVFVEGHRKHDPHDNTDKGYDEDNLTETAVLRHNIDKLPAKSFAKVELLQDDVLKLSNFFNFILIYFICSPKESTLSPVITIKFFL